MPWEHGQNKHTLLLQKLPDGKTKVYMFLRVTTLAGTTYLEPLPSDTLSLRDITFDEVQTFEYQGTRRGENATELSLTSVSGDQKFGGRKG